MAKIEDLLAYFCQMSQSLPVSSERSHRTRVSHN